MNSLKKIAVIAMIIYMPLQSGAWSLLGHRIVGQIADSYLTVKAKAAIKKILGDESIAMASNWPDFIKSDSTFDYLDTWHYINIDGGKSSEEFYGLLKSDTAVDAYTKINFLVAELKKKNLAQDKKVMYLRLLIHIVGDIHQPLHVGRGEDHGGNKIKVLWFNNPFNLHSVWDSQLINYQQLSYTEYATAINHASLQQRKIWQKQTPADWMFGSYQIAEKIYADVKPDEKLSYGYNFKYIDTVNQQLLKGGVRLAGLLNEIFK